MNIHEQILASAKQTIETERDAIASLTTLLDQEFAHAVALIFNSKGRIVLTGIGKSAIIAQKIVATLNSTGTPAVFMHAADAIHGDLGTIMQEDVVICISKSGNSPEIKVLVPLIKKMGNTLIALTANRSSFLGKEADFVIHAKAEKEACPNNLAPTTSTTTQLVMGDAIAIALLELHGFTSSDFAKYHPGGTLGKKLYLQVKDIIQLHDKPWVTPTASVKEVIVEISKKMLGVAAVVDNNTLLGVVTDGDIRRMLEKNDILTGLTAQDIMSNTPKVVNENEMAVAAMDILETHSISQLLAVDDKGRYTGVIHLHDLIKEGII
ncbi:MAG TPA: KpsF/GutQ family sugar-phosphate isomerase [Leeuwenhoekiella sp.]|nr:KpsF/GutQ family sugar-phosphate isomerase [Leeuwenhoekiella sp.]